MRQQFIGFVGDMAIFPASDRLSRVGILIALHDTFMALKPRLILVRQADDWVDWFQRSYIMAAAGFTARARCRISDGRHRRRRRAWSSSIYSLRRYKPRRFFRLR